MTEGEPIVTGPIETLPGTIEGWQIAKHRESVVGRAVTVAGDDPVILATGIEHGCTVVWFAVSSSGDIDGRIGAVTPNDGIEIRLRHGCVWRMSLVNGNLTIARRTGSEALDISVLVVKL